MIDGHSDTKPEIYTAQYVMEVLGTMVKALKEDENDHYIFKGQLCELVGIPLEYWTIWGNKFKENDQIVQTMKQIETIMLNRAVVGGLKNKLNASITKFHLMNNYGWAEKQETKHSGEIESGNKDIKEVASDLKNLLNGQTTDSKEHSQEASI